MEYGLLCTAGTVQSYTSIVCHIKKIKFYKQPVLNKHKYHITLAHKTIMATVHLFTSAHNTTPHFDWSSEYTSCNELSMDNESPVYAILQFDRSVYIPSHTLLIGSKLDVDIESKSCRLAFVCDMIDSYNDRNQHQLSIVKLKQKSGVIDRVENEHTVIVRELFDKNVDCSIFIDYHVSYVVDDRIYTGRIESTFGKSGKVRCVFNDALPCSKSEDNKGKIIFTLKDKTIILKYKKYVDAKGDKRFAPL